MSGYVIPETEAEFQRRVIDLAESFGWQWLHVEGRSSRGIRSAGFALRGTLAKGWPDLLLLRGSQLIAAELKAQHAPPPSTDQLRVLQLLSEAVKAYVWRPSDLPLILETLR